ncbi:hypothetical protein [Mycoplasma sp. 5370]
MNKINLNKDKIILYLFISLFLISLIIGIILTVLGTADYDKFVELNKQLSILKEGSEKYNSISKLLEAVNITKFIYGIFLLLISFLSLIFSSLTANSLFNKKLR